MLAALGLVIAVVLAAIYARPDMRHCRWRADRPGNEGAAAKYVCAACGAVAFTETGRAPEHCARRSPGAKDA